MCKDDKSRLQAGTLLWLMHAGEKSLTPARILLRSVLLGFSLRDSSPAPAILLGMQAKHFTSGLDAEMGLTFGP